VKNKQDNILYNKNDMIHVYLQNLTIKQKKQKMSTCPFTIGHIVKINNCSATPTLVGVVSTVIKIIQPSSSAPWWRIELNNCPGCFFIEELDLFTKEKSRLPRGHYHDKYCDYPCSVMISTGECATCKVRETCCHA